ncbi:MAG: hypothetical protein ACI8QS_002100 [Planctomycetota bacterium]
MFSSTAPAPIGLRPVAPVAPLAYPARPPYKGLDSPMDDTRLRDLARRAISRARVELGATGVSSGAKPGSSQAMGGLLSVEDLATVADGSRLAIPAGTRVTPLARDEAWRRGIILLEDI